MKRIIGYVFIIIPVLLAFFVQNICPQKTHYVDGFIDGYLVLIILNRVIYGIMYYLRWKGDTLAEFKEEKKIRLSPTFAFFEQFLFFLAAIARKEVFSLAVGGWLVIKGIHRWGRWYSSADALKTMDEKEIIEINDRAKKAGLSCHRYLSCLDRNRFMVFLIGTGMSIACGGISGVVYHYYIAE